ncbi:MAG: hypothetical protein K940chlam3_01460 [Chlamydiae bacterium]|nr:hypothetical protein [Chlamydiota bacterium]
MKKIGIIGTGYIARGIFRLIQKAEGFCVSKALTRRNIDTVTNPPREFLTNSVQELVDNSDLIVECSGDAIHATEVLCHVVQASLPIVTMDAELQATTGSYFAKNGYFSEAEGDQPGCLARLKNEAEDMGFHVLAYVNIKGFLNHHPTKEEMDYWSAKQGISLEQTTSFTDGTKLQIEQALVANGLGATIAQNGLIGGNIENIKDTSYLAEKAKELKLPISDYIISPQSSAGVFVLVETDLIENPRNFNVYASTMTGEGNYHILLKPFHFCFLEVLKTIKEALNRLPPLLNNSTAPKIGVASIAKRSIKKGEFIKRALGGFDVRGIAVKIKEHPEHVPIALLANAQIIRNLEPEQEITWDDVELPESKALSIYQDIFKGL